MDAETFSIIRLYKNADGTIIRTDTVSISGFFIRANTYKNIGGYRITPESEQGVGVPKFVFGDWVFQATHGRRVETNLLLGSTEDRTVAEIQLLGSWIAVGASPNYNTVTWRGGTIYMDDLPQIGDDV